LWDEFLSVINSNDGGVKVERESFVWDGLSGFICDENNFNSWLRTGRTILTLFFENNGGFIWLILDGDETFVDFDGVLFCCAAITASRSVTRADCWTTVGMGGLIVFVIACPGRGRVGLGGSDGFAKV
jgi:hypothetical protein